MEYREDIIALADGRKLEIATLGEPSGHTIVFHHGTPGSIRMVHALAAVAQRGSFYIVTLSRAGYGRSSRHEGRRVASCASDVIAALDHLGRSSYSVVGWSGGGPHALACASLDADRCVRAVCIAGVVPLDVDFDWTEGMGPENVEEFELAKRGGHAYEAHMAESGAQLASATSENVIELFGGLLSQADKDALALRESREVMAEALRHGFSEGWRGFYDDDRAFFSPWGFDPVTIEVPVSIFYGDEDLMVPPTHGKWLSDHLPTAESYHFASEGHLSILSNHVDEITEALTGARE
ncbi:MAG: alpha/beta fold hydrolase [Acidimicrobiales bacterium]